MHLLCRASAIRAIEAASFARGEALMPRAGLAAASAAQTLAGGSARRILVLAGPGNNGGDAFEAACHLRGWGTEVTLAFAADPARLPTDAALAHARWCQAGGTSSTELPDPAQFELVIDGLFGIGLGRAIGTPYDAWIAAVNAAGVPVLALDVPSGLDADSGAASGVTIRADTTVTFIADKPGLHTGDGVDLAGRVEVAALDLRVGAPFGREVGSLLARADFAGLLAPRRRNSHKGTYGTLVIVGGASGMVGAAILAARAGLKLGAGRVIAGLLDGSGLAYDPPYPEIMIRDARSALASNAGAVVAGPGMGGSKAAREALEAAIAASCTLVLDADALNIVAADPRLAAQVSRRSAPTIMTPHPLEAARLAGTNVARVNADRIGTALSLAHVYQAHVLLKGAGSVIATPSERWWINPTGNPGMAAGGMGDALAGIIGALVARHEDVESALKCATFLHGAAADTLVDAGVGPAGLTAGETIDAARRQLNAWRT
ncbi:MAG: NAD(P)H-hydrate dehydratase [Burkholderiales bacterium]